MCTEIFLYTTKTDGLHLLIILWVTSVALIAASLMHENSHDVENGNVIFVIMHLLV